MYRYIDREPFFSNHFHIAMKWNEKKIVSNECIDTTGAGAQFNIDNIGVLESTKSIKCCMVCEVCRGMESVVSQ